MQENSYVVQHIDLMLYNMFFLPLFADEDIFCGRGRPQSDKQI